jgi:hypothetical protein
MQVKATEWTAVSCRVIPYTLAYNLAWNTAERSPGGEICGSAHGPLNVGQSEVKLLVCSSVNILLELHTTTRRDIAVFVSSRVSAILMRRGP